MRRIVAISMMAGLCGCSGYSEARRTAAQMAEATDAYVADVTGQLSSEQEYYEKARAEVERGGDVSTHVVNLVDGLIRDEKTLQWPGEFADALMEVNTQREEGARRLAADRAAVREAYADNLSRLEVKRSELILLRASFEALAKELSIDARVAYIERLATHVLAAMRRSDQ